MKLLLLLPVILVLLFASTSIIFAQSLGMTITATADRNSDIITVTGKTVSDITDVTFRVTSPSGNNVVAVVQVSPNDDGEFMVNFIVGPTWYENGFYKIEAMQPVQQNSLYALHVFVEVNDGMTEKTFVTESNIGVGNFPEACVGCSIDDAREEANQLNKNILVYTDKEYYSYGDVIIVTGKIIDISKVRTALSLTVIAPNGNVVLIDQLKVNQDKTFNSSIAAGGALMKVDGIYKAIVRYGGNDINSAITSFEFGGSTAIPPTNSKCGPGTVFDYDFNSCVLIPNKKHLDNNPINENISLQEKNTQLKLENKQLKNKINKLELKLVNLQNIINEQLKVIMDILLEFKSSEY